MKRAVWAKVFLALSIMLCAAVSFVTHRWPTATWGGNNELNTLRGEADRLRDATDDAVALWQKKAAVPSRKGWSTGKLEEFQRSFASPWNCEWQAPEAGFRRAVISRYNAPLVAWKEILNRTQNLEDQPGLAIEKVEIVVTGNGAERRFARIAFTVRIALALQGNAARPASLGSRSVSGRLAPARSRATGVPLSLSARRQPGPKPPGPSLRASHPGPPRATPVSMLTYSHTRIL